MKNTLKNNHNHTAKHAIKKITEHKTRSHFHQGFLWALKIFLI